MFQRRGRDALVECATDVGVDGTFGTLADGQREFDEPFRLGVERAGRRTGLAQGRVLVPHRRVVIREVTGDRWQFLDRVVEFVRHVRR